MTIALASSAVAALLAHARRTMPDECCGLLIGSPQHVVDAMPARNLRASPTRFLIDPADQFAAVRRARAAGFSVVGAYHSHAARPGAAPVPSATDLNESHDPDLLHIIIAPATGAFAAYRLTPPTYTRLEIAVV